MRVLAACLVGFLGLGALTTMAACSDSTDAGSAGAAGSGGGSAAGSAGKASSAGSTSAAGTAGGSAECGFKSVDCSTCLGDKCGDQANACGLDDTCGGALSDLADCVCDPKKDAETCINSFVTDNGDVALKLSECYTLNCEDACK